MRRILQFIKEAGGWAMASGLTALVFYLLGLWERARDRSVSAFVFVSLAVPLFWLGAIIVYRKKHREVEELRAALGIPELYLQHFEHYRNNFVNSGFFLRVEGERKASNVEITSEPTVGNEHVKLEMVWFSPGHPVGKDPVAVRVECRYSKDGYSGLYHNRTGDQIYSFFEH